MTSGRENNLRVAHILTPFYFFAMGKYGQNSVNKLILLDKFGRFFCG
jgi:hypothetical protein